MVDSSMGSLVQTPNQVGGLRHAIYETWTFRGQLGNCPRFEMPMFLKMFRKANCPPILTRFDDWEESFVNARAWPLRRDGAPFGVQALGGEEFRSAEILKYVYNIYIYICKYTSVDIYIYIYIYIYISLKQHLQPIEKFAHVGETTCANHPRRDIF